jgi:hypothetical protein
VTSSLPIRRSLGSLRGAAGAPIPVWSFDGCLVSLDFEWKGSFRAVFRHAAIAIPDLNGRQVTLLHPSQHLVPYSIRIPWKLVQPAAGSRVILSHRNRQMTITGDDGRSRVLVLKGEGVSLKLPEQKSHPSRAAIKEQIHDLPLPPRTRSLMELRALCAEPAEKTVLLKVGDGLRQVADLLCRNETSVEAYHATIQPLIGLGPGLTPSGDDMLVGVAAAACRFARDGWLQERAVYTFLSVLSNLPENATTRTSREMLSHAALRSFSEPLLQFVRVLGESGEDGRQLPEHARRLLSIGGQSGHDLMAGALGLARMLIQR